MTPPTPQPSAPALVPLLLRDREVAQLLGICRATVWKLSATGELPQPVRIGGWAARWERAAILRYVEALTEGRP